jgi:hypothetical protein
LFRYERSPSAIEQDDASMQEDEMLRDTNIQRVHHLLLRQESMNVDGHRGVKITAILDCAPKH